MPNDALNYTALVGELHGLLIGGRVTKVSMPKKDMVVLTVNGKNLLLSTTRCHITTVIARSPSASFGINSQSAVEKHPFLTHLKKHLSGAILIGITQIPFERVLTFAFDTKNDLGYHARKSLILEIWGKGNIILTDEDNKITDCLRHMSLDDSARPLLPRMPYSPPPCQAKISPHDFVKLVTDVKDGNIAAQFSKTVFGLSPASITEVVFRTQNNLPDLYTETANPRPCATATDFYFTPYKHITLPVSHFPSLSAAMDAHFTALETKTAFDTTAAALRRAVNAEISRLKKNLSTFTEQLNAAKDCETDKKLGELITANIYKLKNGMSQFETVDYYTGGNIIVPLDPLLSPAQNAQRYYKRHNKKRRAAQLAQTQITQIEEQLANLDITAYNLSQCTTTDDLADMADELQLADAKTPAKTDKTAAAPVKTKIGGYAVYIGKNSVQNDRLVRDMSPNDIWLHVKDLHGSHVIIKNLNKKAAPPPPEIIKKAASYAAHFSKGKDQGSVSVDYTLGKHVTRLPGKALGKVTYTGQRTLVVTPQAIE